jgi:hypothetical protein
MKYATEMASGGMILSHSMCVTIDKVLDNWIY